MNLTTRLRFTEVEVFTEVDAIQHFEYREGTRKLTGFIQLRDKVVKWYKGIPADMARAKRQIRELVKLNDYSKFIKKDPNQEAIEHKALKKSKWTKKINQLQANGFQFHGELVVKGHKVTVMHKPVGNVHEEVFVDPHGRTNSIYTRIAEGM